MKNVRHVGLVVSNIEKALKFYRDLLGLKLEGSTDEYGDFISDLFARDGIELKTQKLSADDNATRIELIEFSNPESNQNEKVELFNQGFTHIALTVNNLDELYGRLKDAGVKFNSTPKLSTNKSLKVTFCKDFDGNYVELIQEI